ncbi:MAG TPA: hypothetical protein VHL58_13430 [Thermoanaerobaculia bacterium]|nr:hypothetical protein [Thermoanaerobaculia bacterium]
MAQIKGFAIRGLLKYGKTRRPGSIPGLLAVLSPSLQPSFQKPISSSQWYPYEAFSELLRAVDRQLGKGDFSLCPPIGEFAAEQDINGIFKVLMGMLNPKTMLDRSNVFWAKYCDTGKFSAVTSGSQQFVLRLDGFRMDQAHCQLIIGFMRRWALIARASDVEVSHTLCVHRGDEHCQWEGNWK